MAYGQMTLKDGTQTQELITKEWEAFAGLPLTVIFRPAVLDVDDELLGKIDSLAMKRGIGIQSQSRRIEWAEGQRCELEIREKWRGARVLTSLAHSVSWVLGVGMLDSSCQWSGVGVDFERTSRLVHPRLSEFILEDNEKKFPLTPLDFWIIKEACFKSHFPQSEGSHLRQYQIQSFDELSGKGRALGPNQRWTEFQLLREVDGWTAGMARTQNTNLSVFICKA